LSYYSRNCYSKPITYNSPDKFLLLLRKMVSSRGEIEVDVRTNTLIVIDEESRVKNILEFVKLLDESGFTLEEIVNNPNVEIK
jgi:type II secretory pathway component GspD/PulD (secretin)